ncbi:iron chelate uptake ABC transporter family permease subunit [Devosia sp.]|uniref:FecCD family ABC transporter permease n=1 Tax=Devosia sp. TaxID=1871048 RepID=UPI001AD3E20A|nr:iron chelate uptake ABC transporter family permease subunit [Devosia sp.]MBN9334269.1 iron chelate uptake ABC transporter family permease subunit [Devosia sp.]
MTDRPAPHNRPAWRPLPGIALPYHPRSLRLLAISAVAILALIVATLLSGEFTLSPTGVWQTLIGQQDDNLANLVVLELRLPRILACILIGLALGLSGAIFQGLARNPLASPDVVGFTTGAATGVLLLLLVEGFAITASLSVGAMVGGFGTALVVYLLTMRRGVHGQRLILVGIAVGAMLAALNAYLITRAELESAQAARIWMHGSLNGVSWPQVLPLVFWTLLLVPLAMALSRRLGLLEFGDDIATGLGLPVNRSKTLLIVVSITLAAAAISVGGPIGFVALAAPQLAKKLSGTGGITLLPSAAIGATLLLAADLMAQRLLAPFQIPVGLLTGALGGAYLLYLLSRGWRRVD